MKYCSLFAFLGVLGMSNLHAMGGLPPVDFVQNAVGQGGQQANLQRFFIPFNNLSDAAQSEEFAAGNLQSFVNSYIGALNYRRALIDQGADPHVLYECEMIIDGCMGNITQCLSRIGLMRNSVKFAISNRIVEGANAGAQNIRPIGQPPMNQQNPQQMNGAGQN